MDEPIAHFLFPSTIISAAPSAELKILHRGYEGDFTRPSETILLRQRSSPYTRVTRTQTRSFSVQNLLTLSQSPNEASIPSAFASTPSASASAWIIKSALIATSSHWRLLPRPRSTLFEVMNYAVAEVLFIATTLPLPSEHGFCSCGHYKTLASRYEEAAMTLKDLEGLFMLISNQFEEVVYDDFKDGMQTKPEAWSRLAKAQLNGLCIKDAIDLYMKAADPSNFALIIEISNHAGKHDDLVCFLQMARITLCELMIDTDSSVQIYGLNFVIHAEEVAALLRSYQRWGYFDEDLSLL
ncbi:hypothetical protein EDD22DRAFT_998780 [Suillus occidentalis]|nr:hypothetical protein EDD22DRAFT_998780 [Suillus occidentalis]